MVMPVELKDARDLPRYSLKEAAYYFGLPATTV